MSRAVVTADLGPDRTVTAMPIENVDDISFDFNKGLIVIHAGITRHEFAYTGITTVTFSISGGNTTVTIS